MIFSEIKEEAAQEPAMLESAFIQKNAAKRIAYGAVMVPGEPDSDGDVVTKDKILEVANGFMENWRYNDLMHEVGEVSAVPVQSWVSDATVTKNIGEEVVQYPEGTWFMAVKVNEKVWPDVQSGKITGFSIMAVLEEQLAGLKSSIGEASSVKNAGDAIEAAMKRITISDLEKIGSWSVPCVSLVDDPAVGKAKFYALKSVNHKEEQDTLSMQDDDGDESEEGGSEMTDLESANKKGGRNNTKDRSRLDQIISLANQIKGGGDTGNHDTGDTNKDESKSKGFPKKGDDEKKTTIICRAPAPLI